jgi:hypothetical protein
MRWTPRESAAGPQGRRNRRGNPIPEQSPCWQLAHCCAGFFICCTPKVSNRNPWFDKAMPSGQCFGRREGVFATGPPGPRKAERQSVFRAFPVLRCALSSDPLLFFCVRVCSLMFRVSYAVRTCGVGYQIGLNLACALGNWLDQGGLPLLHTFTVDPAGGTSPIGLSSRRRCGCARRASVHRRHGCHHKLHCDSSFSAAFRKQVKKVFLQ